MGKWSDFVSCIGGHRKGRPLSFVSFDWRPPSFLPSPLPLSFRWRSVGVSPRAVGKPITFPPSLPIGARRSIGVSASHSPFGRGKSRSPSTAAERAIGLEARARGGGVGACLTSDRIGAEVEGGERAAVLKRLSEGREQKGERKRPNRELRGSADWDSCWLEKFCSFCRQFDT